MDKFISLTAVPIGILICFGPALLVWVLAEIKDSAEGEKKEPRNSSQL